MFGVRGLFQTVRDMSVIVWYLSAFSDHQWHHFWSLLRTSHVLENLSLARIYKAEPLACRITDVLALYFQGQQLKELSQINPKTLRASNSTPVTSRLHNAGPQTAWLCDAATGGHKTLMSLQWAEDRCTSLRNTSHPQNYIYIVKILIYYVLKLSKMIVANQIKENKK